MSSKKKLQLKGQIKRITYYNQESGYTVAQIMVGGRRQPVTVVGNLIEPTPGQVLEMEGEWKVHSRYGKQFHLSSCKCTVPASTEGIRRYLGSGLIEGIGPVMAGRIVKAFGEETLAVIDSDINRLLEVEGIGKKRLQMIAGAWEEQRDIQEIMLFLLSHGISSAYATKIYREYQEEALEILQDNPYRLATDIWGIGFITADKIARRLDFAVDSQERVEAGILYVLNQLVQEGHVFYPYEPLIEKCREILEVDREIILSAFGRIALEKRIVIEDLNQSLPEYKSNNKAVYLKPFHVAETGTAALLKGLLSSQKSIRSIDTEKAIAWVQEQLSIRLDPKQVEAIRAAIEKKVLVITGGPGTGKTTIINGILKIFSMLEIDIKLAAPTGRAARRMEETGGLEASTIHRLLDYNPFQGGFRRDQEDRLECDLLILDEASMIDNILIYHLLKALPVTTTLILVGDVNQLPSVGAGNVLLDIINSRQVPVVRLEKIFRQAKKSSIVVNAHRINSGRMPILDNSSHQKKDFYFIEEEKPERVLELIIRLVGERIPESFAFDPLDDIQVLSPMHRGVVGTTNLNQRLQEELNPGSEALSNRGEAYRPGDKVMQVRNNYHLEVFNGDIGRITSIDGDGGSLVVSFNGRGVEYSFSQLDQLQLAYAVSVHKSQGSEYPVVVLPLLTQHYMMLQRNLIYTAVTRGKQLVVVVGTRRALRIAINNNKQEERFSLLGHRLEES